MVLCTIGQEKYFDPHLQQNIRKKNYEAVTYTLHCYFRGEFPSKLGKLKDSSQATLLHYVTMNGNVEIVRNLLNMKCKVDAQDDSRKTALYGAYFDYFTANERFVEVRLLRYDADPHPYAKNTRGYDVCTIFHLVKFHAVDFHCRFFSRYTKDNVAALFAALRKLGRKIDGARCAKFPLEPYGMKHMKLELQLQRVKETTIYGDVTLYQFLVGGQKKVNAYMRNEEFVSELEKTIKEFEVDSPYANELRTRFAEAIQLVELKKKAINAICWVINSKNCAFYYIAEVIMDYLSEDDMKILCLLQNE